MNQVVLYARIVDGVHVQYHNASGQCKLGTNKYQKGNKNSDKQFAKVNIKLFQNIS